MDFPRRDIDRNKDQRRGHSVGQLRAEIPHWIEESAERTAIHELLAEAETAERREAAAVVAQQHQERQRWVRYSTAIGIAGFLLALAGRFWPTSQVASLERRVTTIEQNQLVYPTPITPAPLASPQQNQSTSKPRLAPSTATPSATQAQNPTTPAPKATP